MSISDFIIPPWVKVAVPLALLAAAGGGEWLLIHSRNHWKATAATEQTQIADRDSLIRSMTTKQDVQNQISTKTVEKVVTVPGPVQTIIKTIHDAPLPPDCATPGYPAVRNEI